MKTLCIVKWETHKTEFDIESLQDYWSSNLDIQTGHGLMSSQGLAIEQYTCKHKKDLKLSMVEVHV